MTSDDSIDKTTAVRSPASADGPLPTGRHKLSREEVAASQRQRLLDAMAELCSTKGYYETTIAEIVAVAGVSRATYYELFNDKEDCFVATMEEGLRRLQGAVLPVAMREDGGSWPERVLEVADALLAFIAANPTYSKTAMVEALAGGERAFELYSAGTSMIATLLDQVRELASPEVQLPKTTTRAVLGGGEWLIVSEMIAGRTERVPELLPDIMYMAVLPFLGQEEALRQMNAVIRDRRA